jgi:hypothetical protein
MRAFYLRFLPVLSLISFFGLRVFAGEYHKVVVVTGASASEVEQNVARLLVERIGESSPIPASILSESSQVGEETRAPGTLTVLLGRQASHEGIRQRLFELRIPPLDGLNPGVEGFLLHKANDSADQSNVVLAAGVDNRGVLYAVGEILRQFVFKERSIVLPALWIRTAPAFEVRGTQYGQSHNAKRFGKVREWTEKETQKAVLDLALAGANTFLIEEKSSDIPFLKSFDLMTATTYNPNAGALTIPKEWMAEESIGRLGYVCLSVPEGVEFVLKKAENFFKSSQSFDFIQMKGGDGGGCECDRCRPYGKTFIHVAEKMAAIIHRYHPETKLYFTNQKFDNEGDQAILDYLNEKPRDWLWAWGYGPGSDATTWQPGHRQNHRMDLFRYPGFGPYGLYPKEILHQLPKQQKILYFNEVTHWKYAQHGYVQMYPRADRDGNLPPRWSHEIYERRPDQALTAVYDRLSFYAWPKYYHRVFNDLMRYGVGDITHSSGNHDHFNQWMWQRLLWSPRQPVEAVVEEYVRVWFGPQAAPWMSKALFQLEENLEEVPGLPITEKKGIDDYYHWVKKAGEVMPAHYRNKNWLWRMYMQKGAIDRYVKLDVMQQVQTQTKIENFVTQNRKKENFNHHVKKLNGWIDAVLDSETAEMKRLREEAEQLGEESNELYGTRSEGIFNLNHDFIGLGWTKRQLERVQTAKNTQERDELLGMITDYDNPGEGGFYDNLGSGGKAPNVVFGYPYDHGQPYVPDMLWESNRPSQRALHFTQEEDQGVTLHYRNLEAGRSYKLRLTLVRPWFQERYAERMNQKAQSIYANDVLIAKDVELPLQMSDFFTFEIPAHLIKNGELVIRLERGEDVARGNRVTIEQWRNTGGWGTLLSEAWLIRQ